MTRRRRLAFVSPRFLFPTDSGGKIRTSQILRGMKDGEFDITLAMPGSEEDRTTFREELQSVADRVVLWRRPDRHPVFSQARRALAMTSRYPVSVSVDYDPRGARAVQDILDDDPEVVVFDFPHSAVLAPGRLHAPSVMFTHNVESEIFGRHARVARTPWARAVWRNQHGKMLRFERQALSRFDTVVAVSERDCRFFEDEWGIGHCRSIPTGVDTDHLGYRAPDDGRQVVFCGSMDWMANVDAVEYFHDSVWPLVRDRVPGARMKVVGRSPPASLVERIRGASPEWEFTGFVDDIREHVGGAAAFVIPLRVGSGTRIKAFEAMAMGSPVVSTTIGVEGLPVNDGEDVLIADGPEAMAAGVTSMLTEEHARMKISRAARRLVEERFGFREAARRFEAICLETAERGETATRP